MSNAIQLSRQALRAAFEIRRQVGISNAEPVCVFDLAEKLGVEVKFFSAGSFDGIYARTSQTVIVPSLRPSGRQAFTCAHELAHWYFNHGSRIEELELFDVTYNRRPEERLANVFAAYLLMPPLAVKNAFLSRAYDPATCSCLQAYTISCQFGVGYSTLIKHLQLSLGLITSAHAANLLRTTPKEIRDTVLGDTGTRQLLIVDRQWRTVPIDIQVGDLAIFPTDVKLEGESARIIGAHKTGSLIRGCIPGISRAELYDESWASFIRVSRQNFVGRSIYRHLEDPDVD